MFDWHIDDVNELFNFFPRLMGYLLAVPFRLLFCWPVFEMPVE